MSFSKKITLSLLLSGVTATIQPLFATGTNTGTVYATDKWAITVATAANAGEITATATEKAAVVQITDTASSPATHSVGLYGCIMSDLTPLGTQGFTMTAGDDNEAVANGAQATDARTFWGTLAAHQGTMATKDNMLTQAGIDGNSFFECCTATTFTVANADTYGQCPSAFLLADVSGAMDYTATLKAADRVGFLTAATTLLLDGAGDGVVIAGTWNDDFLLASQAQLNTDDSDDTIVGFCSGAWKRTMTTDSAITLEALKDFNSNTKCTWQITAKSGSAPQFELKEAPTSQFLVHFVEWTDHSTTTELATEDLLPATDAANTLKIGDYDQTAAKYFNPYTDTSVVAATGFGTNTDDDFQPIERDSSPDTNSYFPGSARSRYNIYAAGTSPFAVAETLIVEDDMYFVMGLQAGLNAAAAIYSDWEDQLADYNDEAADYNDDVAAYNDALEAGDDELPEVPERPCPPAELEEIENVQPFINAATAFDATDYEDEGFAAEYAPYAKTVSTAAIVDSWTYGYLRTAASEATASNDYDQEYTDISVGKVFGRFGQGAANMPGAITPFRYADSADSSSYVQNLMLSIFPSVGTSWNGSGPIASDTIELEVSGAELSWTETLIVPSASGSADDLDDKDFAKVLGASAMIMAASIAALY